MRTPCTFATDTTCDCDSCEREVTLAAEFVMFRREAAERAARLSPAPAPLPLSLALSPAIIAEMDADPTV